MSRARVIMLEIAVFAAVGAAAVLASQIFGADRGPRKAMDGPLGSSSQLIDVNLDADFGRVNDVDPIVDLANPFEVDLRIVEVASVDDVRSPAALEVVTFYLVGPGRTQNSITGGIQTAEDYGVPLIPADRAVVPAGAKSDDYRLMVRLRMPAGVAWARTSGFMVTYQVGSEMYQATWPHSFTYCSVKALGERFCRRVGTAAVDLS